MLIEHMPITPTLDEFADDLIVRGEESNLYVEVTAYGVIKPLSHFHIFMAVEGYSEGEE